MRSVTDPVRIMTVCTGNICRSPMAQIVLTAALADAGLGDVAVVESTGVSSEERGNPLDPRAAAALTARGYTLPQHTARQVVDQDLRDNDLVLAMTASHARALRALAQRAARHGSGSGDDLAARVVMYRSFDPDAPLIIGGGHEALLDVEDPWYGGPSDFEECLDQIEHAAPGVVEYVRRATVGR